MRAVVLLVALVACKNPPFYASVNAKVVDDRVELELYGDPGMTVTIPGQPPVAFESLTGYPPKISVPLEGYPDGENTLEVKFEARGESVTKTVTFTKAKGAGKPFVRLADCASSSTSGWGSAKLDAGPLGKIEYCWLWSDGAARINVHGSLGGKVTLGDKTVELDKDGKAQIVVPLRPLLVRAPVRAAVSDGAGITSELPVAFARGTTKIDGKVAIDLASAAKDMTRTLFADVTTGTPIAGDAVNRTKSSLVYLPADKYRGPFHHGKLSTVAEVGLVAIGHDTESRDGGKCGPYSSTKGAPGDGMAPRKLIDVEIEVYDAATGQKVGAKAFTADASVECPMIATSKGGVWETVESRPEERVIDAWLDRVAATGKL